MEIRGFRVSAKYQETVKGFPNCKQDTMYHNKFRVVVIRDKVRRSFDFYDSAHNYDLGIDTLDNEALQSALYSFLSDAQAGEMDFAEFCSEFGYNEDSSRRTWRACQKTANKVKGFNLTEDELIDHLNALNC